MPNGVVGPADQFFHPPLKVRGKVMLRQKLHHIAILLNLRVQQHLAEQVVQCLICQPGPPLSEYNSNLTECTCMNSIYRRE